MNKIAAIIVTYNRKTMLLQTIEHLKQQLYKNFDVLIIDNDSTDGTQEVIQKYVEEGYVDYVNTGANLGGAGGFQFGMKIAIEKGYEYLWIMDDDCLPDKEALDKLMEADQILKGEYGFLSSIAYWKDNILCNMNVQKTSMIKKIELSEEKYIPVIMATFVSAFFRADIVKEMGLPIKEFFIWSDDLEYTRRISLKYTSYVVTESKVLHAMNSNDKVNIATDSPERLNRYSYLYRNEVYVYRREGIIGWIYLFMRLVLHILRVMFIADGYKSKKIKIILKSFKEGLKFKPQIEYISASEGR